MLLSARQSSDMYPELKLLSPAGSQPISFKWKAGSARGVDIIETIRWVVRDLPDLKCVIERNILTDYDVEDYESMKCVCERFNKAIDKLVRLERGTSIPMKRLNKYPCNGLLKHVLQQAYNEAVIDPEKLNRYEPFSPEVYGETSYDMVDQIINQLDIKEDDVFVDLGSGVGQVVMHIAAAASAATCFGIEKAEVPSRYAKMMDEHFRAWMDWFGKKYNEYELIKGDFLEEQYRDKLLSATIVFVNNFAFGPQVDHGLKLIFAELKDGVKIISSKSFCPLNFRITDRNLSDVGTIMRVRELASMEGSVSWTDKSVAYFLHVIDRAKLENYFRRNKTPIFEDDSDSKFFEQGRFSKLYKVKQKVDINPNKYIEDDDVLFEVKRPELPRVCNGVRNVASRGMRAVHNIPDRSENGANSYVDSAVSQSLVKRLIRQNINEQKGGKTKVKYAVTKTTNESDNCMKPGPNLSTITNDIALINAANTYTRTSLNMDLVNKPSKSKINRQQPIKIKVSLNNNNNSNTNTNPDPSPRGRKEKLPKTKKIAPNKGKVTKEPDPISDASDLIDPNKTPIWMIQLFQSMRNQYVSMLDASKTKKYRKTLKRQISRERERADALQRHTDAVNAEIDELTRASKDMLKQHMDDLEISDPDFARVGDEYLSLNIELKKKKKDLLHEIKMLEEENVLLESLNATNNATTTTTTPPLQPSPNVFSFDEDKKPPSKHIKLEPNYNECDSFKYNSSNYNNTFNVPIKVETCDSVTTPPEVHCPRMDVEQIYGKLSTLAAANNLTHSLPGRQRTPKSIKTEQIDIYASKHENYDTSSDIVTHAQSHYLLNDHLNDTNMDVCAAQQDGLMLKLNQIVSSSSSSNSSNASTTTAKRNDTVKRRNPPSDGEGSRVKLPKYKRATAGTVALINGEFKSNGCMSNDFKIPVSLPHATLPEFPSNGLVKYHHIDGGSGGKMTLGMPHANGYPRKYDMGEPNSHGTVTFSAQSLINAAIINSLNNS